MCAAPLFVVALQQLEAIIWNALGLGELIASWVEDLLQVVNGTSKALGGLTTGLTGLVGLDAQDDGAASSAPAVYNAEAQRWEEGEVGSDLDSYGI